MSRKTSMLVVSNRVYAKREEDGALHPGLVESKQKDCYTVKFSDETRSAILERDLIWIAFWGLPSSCWPEYPVIQTTVLGTVELDDKIRSMANKVADRESKETALFTVNEISESEESLSDSSSSSVEDSQSVNKLNDGAKQNPIQMCASSEPTRSQTRPSVLRLNTGLLHKDSPHSHLLSSSPRKEATETVKILPRLSSSIQENLENNDSKFKSKFLIESEDRSCIKNTSSFPAERTSPNSKFLLTTKFANNSESLWSLTGREMENQTNTRHISLNPDAAWYSRDLSETFPLNRSNLTPSIIPLISAKYFSQEPLLFRELYETLSRKGPLITDNTQLFNEGQKKRKRSDDTKKCRKVYGVDNRHAWCTQCKWKKACARFGD